MKFQMRPTLLALATTAVLFGAATASASDKLETEKDKISYVIGMQIANSLTGIKDEVDLEIIQRAMKDGLNGAEPLLKPEEAMAVQQAFQQKMQAKQAAKLQEQAAKNKAEGEAFLAKNKTAAGVSNGDITNDLFAPAIDA